MPLLIAIAVAVLGLFVANYVRDLRAAMALAGATPWYRSPIVRSSLLFVSLLVVPPLVVWLAHSDGLFADRHWLWRTSVLLSGAISYTWYRYLSWLDVFEPERRRTVLFVFVLACVSVPVLVPVLHTAVVRATGLHLSGELGNDLVFASVVIGLVEEVVKLLPYLIVLRFTRQVDEPYDHLLYASVSALGFAFVENIGYLEVSQLASVAGRALFSAVAHMCFSSMVAYGIARTLPRGRGQAWLAGLGMLVVAAVAHGLYDVWLLVPGRPAFLTTLLFLATIQVWVIMKNNLVNLSPFMQPHTKLRSTMFRYRIVNAMLAIFMAAFVATDLLYNGQRAWGLLREQGPEMLVVLVILALSFGTYSIVPGYVANLRVSSNPIRWFLPMPRWGPDLSGSRIRVDIPASSWRNLHLPELRRSLPVMGVLERRVVLDGDRDWYVFRPERQLDLGFGFEALFLMRLDAAVDTIPESHYVRMQVRRFGGEPRVAAGRVQSPTIAFAPRFFAQLIAPVHGTGASGLSAMGGHGLS